MNPKHGYIFLKQNILDSIRTNYTRINWGCSIMHSTESTPSEYNLDYCFPSILYIYVDLSSSS
jgi:hypothetical protein